MGGFCNAASVGTGRGNPHVAAVTAIQTLFSLNIKRRISCKEQRGVTGHTGPGTSSH